MDAANTAAQGASRYRCRCCGACCRWPGYVRLDEADVDRIAACLGMDPRVFVEQYTAVTADRRCLTLLEGPDGACIMLTAGQQCRIHSAKPRQCQGFPERWRFPGFETLCQATREQD